MWIFIKGLILRPPTVTLLRLSGKRFLCPVLVLLRESIVFLDFPHHPNVLKKNSDIASER